MTPEPERATPGERRRASGAAVRVLVVDDHALFREGLVGILDRQPDFEVVGQAGDGLEAIVKARQLRPDLVLMDVSMPGCDGIEATREIARAAPEVAVVMLTMRDDEDKLFDALRGGARGYLLKDIEAKTLLSLLRGAAKGHAAITPALAGRILSEFQRLARNQRASGGAPPGPTDDLTPREREVLGMIAEHATDKEIAASLAISLSTVKSHVRSILSKLHVHSRHEAARRAGLQARKREN